MTQSAGLSELLNRQSAILLDFDGPVCNIFANHPAPAVADSLRAVLRTSGVDIAAEVLDERDPLEVLKWSATLGRPDVLKAVETKLRQEEFTAAQSSAPTPYGREVVIGAFEAGKSIAIVSNNSAEAITSYLHRHRLSCFGMPVVGRAFAQPDLMKPNPQPLADAAKSIKADPAQCVLIGDSLTDIVGAQAAGMPVIGYANRPEKVAPFTAAGADLVVTTMAEIAIALIDLSL
jgi:HAD superfamily hydrolase (TIGR01549 family)